MQASKRLETNADRVFDTPDSNSRRASSNTARTQRLNPPRNLVHTATQHPGTADRAGQLAPSCARQLTPYCLRQNAFASQLSPPAAPQGACRDATSASRRCPEDAAMAPPQRAARPRAASHGATSGSGSNPQQRIAQSSSSRPRVTAVTTQRRTAAGSAARAPPARSIARAMQARSVGEPALCTG